MEIHPQMSLSCQFRQLHLIDDQHAVKTSVHSKECPEI